MKELSKATLISPSASVLVGVVVGEGSVIEDFVIIGLRSREKALETKLGQGSHIRSHTVIYAGNSIGPGFQTGHGVLVRELNTIGSNVSIGSHAVVEHHISIGDNVRLHSNVFIPEFSVLEDNCWIGPNVVFTNALYPLAHNAKETLKGPTIRSGAKIGANATLLPGIMVGRNCLVGAGSVVTRDIPDGKVVAGNPARILRDITEIRSYHNF